MKARLIFSVLMLSILMVGCFRADEQVETPVSDEGLRAPAATSKLTAVPPTNTSRATEAVGTEPDKIEAASEPTASQPPEPRPIPCSGFLTSPIQEGPFYSPGSPERSSLIDEGMPGVPILILGRVFDQECNPIPGAKLDFWLADVNGEYDNLGYRLRGHVFTDVEGNYALESIEPTAYTGRPPHIHVKVFSPNGEQLLTTQMCLSGSESSADVSSAPDLLVTYQGLDENGRQQVLFNFVVMK